jgi:hypothetical protein
MITIFFHLSRLLLFRDPGSEIRDPGSGHPGSATLLTTRLSKKSTRGKKATAINLLGNHQMSPRYICLDAKLTKKSALNYTHNLYLPILKRGKQLFCQARDIQYIQYKSLNFYEIFNFFNEIFCTFDKIVMIRICKSNITDPNPGGQLIT